MNRRSLMLLLALPLLACAGLFALLGRRAAHAPVEAEARAELALAGAAEETELAVQDSAARSEGALARPLAPHTPERPALAPESARVAGFLRPQSDEPWRDASVALLENGAGRAPRVLAEVRCEPDGGFALDSGHEGPALFVVLARGFVPLVQELELEHGRELLLEDLDLERGAAIAGTLSSNARPLARFEVVAIDERDLPLVKLAGGELLWGAPELAWRYTTAESGADGRYSIGGLRAGSYQVRVSTCRGSMASLCPGNRAPRPARAPSSDVDFSFESGMLALRFQGAGAPLADVAVELSSGSWRTGRRSDAQGLVWFHLVPRLDCTLVATKPGFADLRLPVSAPASGASALEDLEMLPGTPAPELRFLVTSPRSEVPPELRVRLFRPGEARPALDQSLRPTAESLASPVKVFRLVGAQPGSYRAVLLPGYPWNNDLEPAGYIGTHCAQELALELGSAGVAEQRISVERRPPLRLSFRDEAQRFLPARCTLRDSAGNELAIALVDPAQGIALPGQQLSTLGPTLVYSALCAGKVFVAVDHDGRQLYSGTHELHELPFGAIAIER